MPLLSDLRSGAGTFLYDLLAEPGGSNAAGAGATATASASTGSAASGTAADASGAGTEATASASTGSAIGYAYVTIALPVYEGPGSIFYPENFEGTAADDDVARHPTHGGFEILPDGTIIADEYGEYLCYYNDGSGEVEFVVTLDANARVYATGVTADVQEPGVELYGGVSISGDAAGASATAATGTASAGNLATGAGATATAAPAEGGAGGGAAAAGAGSTATGEAATGVGETLAEALGAGVDATASAAEGSASGDVIAVGAGATATATPSLATARGDRIIGDIPTRVLTLVPPQQKLSRAA